MAIDPEEIDVTTVDKLDDLTLALGNFFAHTNLNGKLGKSDFAELAAFLAPYVSAIGGSGFIATTGTVLPAASNGKYTIVGSGTYTQTTGGNVVTTEMLNILGSTASTWSLVAAIPLPSNLALKEDIPIAIDNKLGSVEVATYVGTRPYRMYTTQTDFVTTSANITQTNSANSDTLTYGSTTATFVLYAETGYNYSNLAKTLVIENKLNNIITNGTGTGFGGDIGGVRTAYVYQSNGTLIKANPFTTAIVANGLPTLSVNDVVRMEVSNGGKTLTVYKNGVSVSTSEIPVFQGLVYLVMRGGGSITANKVKITTSFFAKESSITQLNTDINNLKINPLRPFKSDATFIRDGSQIGTSVAWLKDFLIDIKLFGFPVNDRISLYVVRRNSTDANKYQLQFFRDIGTGTGQPSSTRELVMTWNAPAYVEPDSGVISVVEHTEGAYGFKAYVDWSKAPAGDSGSISYNAAGFARDVYINFKSSNITPQPVIGDVRLLWPYNNTNAPVTGTDLYKQFTVTPDKDSDGDTVGCTGASYNTKTHEYVISYYSFAKESKLWLYSRKDLTAYSPTGTIIPAPTREIDVSSHIYHIQGNVYDPQLDSYWILGSLGAVSTDTERLLIRVDDEGNLLERYLMPQSFQAGMIALSPDLEKILIKPNNKSWLLEIDKSTKSVIRQTNVETINEGLGVDYQNNIVWIAGDTGFLYKYDYGTMALLQTIPFTTLPNSPTINQNVEGIIVDPIDGAIIFVADAFLHGGNVNGNGMWVFDFNKTIKKSIRFPSMMNLVDGESSIIDFGATNNLQNVQISAGSGSIEYRGSNTAPTFPVVNRSNWRDLPFYEDWGATTPSVYSATLGTQRYQQIRYTS